MSVRTIPSVNNIIDMVEVSTPSTPGSNHGRVYVKDDGSGDSALYFLSDSGIETQLGSGGGGGATALPALTDVDDATVNTTSGHVLRANGTTWVNAQLAHSDLSGVGTNAHSVIDTHIDSATTVHAAATNLLHTTGNETKSSGVLTFSTLPEAATNPTTDSQLVRKAYVDAVAQGLEPKAACRVATTAAGTLATDFENGDTIDGIVLATGDRILIKDQADQTTNGIYTVNASGAPTRATDYDATSEVQEGTFTFITSGTANASKQFVQITIDPVLGSSNLVFTQLSGGSAYTASLGVELVGADFRADLLSTGAIGLTGNELKVNTDDSSIEKSSNALQVKALGVTNAMLAGSIADSKLSQITTADKVSGAAVTLLTSVPSGAGKLPTANLGSGTPDTTTFLRGDQSWAVPSGSGAGIYALVYSKTLDTSITTATISNSTAETTIYTYNLPANTLSTNKILKIVVAGTYLNNSGGNKTVTIRMKYGATTVITATTGNIATSATVGQFTYTFYLIAVGATDAQQGYFYGLHTSGTGVQLAAQDNGTAAIDSTASADIVVTADLSAANATQTFTKKFATVQLENGTDNVGAPTDASYVCLATNGNLTNERVLTGTANQITVTDSGAGAAVTLSTPQNIHTTATPTFSGAALSAGTTTVGTLAGAIDAGAATSLEVPNGAGGTTVNATGEVCVDSTSRTLNFYDGTAEVVLNPVISKSVLILSPTAASDYALIRMDIAGTLTKVSYLCIGGTNWVGQLQECDANGINGANVHTADITATAGTVNTSTTFSNAAYDATDYIGIKTTSISGTPTYLVVTWYYRETP